MRQGPAWAQLLECRGLAQTCFNEHVNNCPQGHAFIDVHINYYGAAEHRSPSPQLSLCHPGHFSPSLVPQIFCLSLTTMSYHWLSSQQVKASNQRSALSRPMCCHFWVIQSSAAAYWGRTEYKCWQTQHQPTPVLLYYLSLNPQSTG